MLIEGSIQITLILATFLCSLVAGFLFAFALVVMPGIGRLNDREFIRSFQVIDGIIQNNQPIFVLVWLGSVVVLATSVVLDIKHFDGTGRLLLVSALVAYLFGVQLPTFTINVPLNNKLQTLDISTIDETTCQEARLEFETRWILWNSIRTPLACLVSVLLIFLLSRI